MENEKNLAQNNPAGASKGNVWALLPIGIFIVLYLGLGIAFEYILKIPMGFYNIPIVIAFLVAILVACLQNRKVSFEDKLPHEPDYLSDEYMALPPKQVKAGKDTISEGEEKSHGE